MEIAKGRKAIDAELLVRRFMYYIERKLKLMGR